MLSEGTLLSGGEKDRKIAAWDSLQNYKRITDTKVRNQPYWNLFYLIFEYSYQNQWEEFEVFIHNDLDETMEIFMWEQPEITSWKDHCNEDSIKYDRLLIKFRT